MTIGGKIGNGNTALLEVVWVNIGGKSDSKALLTGII
jgi:hypothetical protein